MSGHHNSTWVVSFVAALCLVAIPALAVDPLDFGDAPQSYKTLLMHDGPRHVIVSGIHIGPQIDAESDGRESLYADGDDVNGTDDEDGVVFVVDGQVHGGLPKMVQVTASTGGYLNAWIDFSRDGMWTNGTDRIFADVPLQSGTNTLQFTAPPQVREGASYARFRFCTVAGLSYTGLAVNGEVEDHEVYIDSNLDFGDAPSGYGTLLAGDGARHVVMPGIFMGTLIDAEDDGRNSINADGDDTQGQADEDGVTFEGGTQLDAGVTKRVRVRTSTNGYLSAWVDFDRGGSWNNGAERVFSNVAVSGGTNDLDFPVPLTLTEGNSYMRFRFSSSPLPSFLGFAADGEVEDYEVYLDANLDFGDVPNSYGTLKSSDGARHVAFPDIRLGMSIDTEGDGRNSVNADGDDTLGLDDEDGVVFVGGTQVDAGIPKVLEVTASTNGYLSAWIDYDRDGTWTAAQERVVFDAPLLPGMNSLSFTPSVGMGEGVSFMRFRFSTLTNLSWIGFAPDGEVEDHKVFLDRNLDFGDAPDTYGTSMSANGPRHLAVPGCHLGTALDTEDDGQPSSNADGDDVHDTDDEDGVIFLGGTQIDAGVTKPLQVTATTNGYLSAWIDYDRSGAWSPAEKVFSDVPLSVGGNALGFAASATLSQGSSYMRFRFSTETNLSTGGFAPDGEVEDYRVYLDSNLDFGDAPQSYGTRLANDGPRHLAIPGSGMGPLIDTEDDGRDTSQADGDDAFGLDDEDGVLFVGGTALYGGLGKRVRITAWTNAYLNAWIDYDRNGAWSGGAEHALVDEPVAAGTNELEFLVYAGAVQGTTFGRFRICSQPGLSSTGYAPDGEVEDYVLSLMQTNPPIRIVAIDKVGNTVTVEWSDPGLAHTLLWTTNILHTNWVATSGSWPAYTNRWEGTDPAGAGSPAFFRTRSQ